MARAEIGLILMTAEGLLAAMFYAVVYPNRSQVGWRVLLLLFVVFLLASYPSGFEQHGLECMCFRARKCVVKMKLGGFGILPETGTST